MIKKISLKIIIAIAVILLVALPILFLKYRPLHYDSPEQVLEILNKQRADNRAPIEKNPANDLNDWKTYAHPEAGFTFKYPADWEIKNEYQSVSAACQSDPKCKGKRYIILDKTNGLSTAYDMEHYKSGIAINLSQCKGIKNETLAGENQICLFGEKTEDLEIYEKIKTSFILMADESISITTGKIDYISGETVKIEIRNNSKQSV